MVAGYTYSRMRSMMSAPTGTFGYGAGYGLPAGFQQCWSGIREQRLRRPASLHAFAYLRHSRKKGYGQMLEGWGAQLHRDPAKAAQPWGGRSTWGRMPQGPVAASSCPSVRLRLTPHPLELLREAFRLQVGSDCDSLFSPEPTTVRPTVCQRQAACNAGHRPEARGSR